MPAKQNNTNKLIAVQTNQLRADQLAHIKEVLCILEDKIKYASEIRKKIALLDSVSLGLYDEIDKLSKKAPADKVTILALEQINNIIRETKDILTSDIYIQRLNEFIPAGDNPEHRDAVIVLRQVRQGLGRNGDEVKSEIDRLRGRISEATLIRDALEITLNGKTSNGNKELEDKISLIFDQWFTSSYPKRFLFEKLDNINMNEYFGVKVSE